MSAFKDMVAADNIRVFLNENEFADRRTVIYDDEVYSDINVVITGLKEQDRKQVADDHVQGIYNVSAIMHLAICDLNGNQPEKGKRIKISDDTNRQFFREFYIASSVCEIGMLRIELEAIDE